MVDIAADELAALEDEDAATAAADGAGPQSGGGSGGGGIAEVQSVTDLVYSRSKVQRGPGVRGGMCMGSRAAYPYC